MTIDEAIKILNTHSKASYSFHSLGFWDAIKLGIEALKRQQIFPELDAYGHRVLLPGEDPE